MAILDDLLANLPRLRGEAEALMQASCIVHRKVGEQRNGITVTPLWSTVYTGKFRLRGNGTYESSNAGQAGATATVQRNEARFPVGAYFPAAGDVIEVTASTDPGLVGSVWRIAQPAPVSELATSYRPPVDRLLGDDIPVFEEA